MTVTEVVSSDNTRWRCQRAELPPLFVKSGFILDQRSPNLGGIPPRGGGRGFGHLWGGGGDGQHSKTIHKIGAYEAGTTISLKPMIFLCSLKSS